MKIAAIIPIKYKSSRVPGKNFKLINNKPLFYYIINTLYSCNYIYSIIINYDKEDVKNIISDYLNKDYLSKIIFYKRPEKLVGCHISTNKLIEDTILNLKDDYDLYLQTHVTNPLLSVKTITETIIKYNSVKNTYDSLFTVKQLQTRLYNKDSKALNHDPSNLIPTQDLDPLYEENSCIYIFNTKTFFTNKKIIGNNPFLFVMNDYES